MNYYNDFDENEKYNDVSRRDIEKAMELIVKNAVIILKTSLISDKIEVNNQQDENEDIDTILKNQNEITAQCTLLRNTLRVDNLSNNVKILAIDLLDDFNKNNWDIEKVDHLVKDFNKNERKCD